MLKFCPGIKCPHYSSATKYPRKCYYEPQCMRGYMDMLVDTMRLFWQYKVKGGKG